jgi:hypothetical protein
MSFCAKCGESVDVSAIFCGSCGNNIKQTKAHSEREEKVFTESSQNDISDSWKNKFRLIDKAGGPNFSKFKDLEFRERLYISFNIWAFLFGVFYYAAKGMWKKGLTLLVISIIIFTIIDMLFGIGNYFGMGVAAIFGSRANIDYYKKIIHGDDEWF